MDRPTTRSCFENNRKATSLEMAYIATESELVGREARWGLSPKIEAYFEPALFQGALSEF